jgi:hypothetical protein
MFEKFFTLVTAICLVVYFYLHAIRLNYYFKNGRGFIFTLVNVFVFNFLFFAIIFLFLDVLTTSTDKDFLFFKEKFAINFLAILEIAVYILIPLLYVYYLNDNAWVVYYYTYLVLWLTTNTVYIKYLDFNNEVGYGKLVPEGLAEYSRIRSTYYRLVYFNFGLLMTIGKLLSVTYIPYGMAKYIHDLIFTTKDQQINNSDGGMRDISEEDEPMLFKTFDDKSAEDRRIAISSDKSDSKNFFSNGSEERRLLFPKSSSGKSKSLISGSKNNSNDSIFTQKSHIRSFSKTNNIMTVKEYIDYLKDIEFQKN